MTFPLTHIPNWFTRLCPLATWNIAHQPRTLYLTFDDGPSPLTTPFILSQLQKYQARATFFCTGKRANRHASLFEQLVESDHSIGNHTYSHLNGWQTSLTQYLADVRQFDALYETSLFRPPYGRLTPRQYWHLRDQYHIILWDVFPRDYGISRAPSQCFSDIQTHTNGGSIIVLHENAKAAATLRPLLPRLLDHFHQQGYTFNALGKRSNFA